jgi:hypothetical protein
VANGGSSSYASLTKTSTYSYTLDNLLYYDRTIGQHTFGLTLLQSATGYTQETSNSTGLGIPLSSQLWNALTSGTVTGSLSTSSNLIEQQLASYMARLNYSFRDKYLLTVSAARMVLLCLQKDINIHGFPQLHLPGELAKKDS